MVKSPTEQRIIDALEELAAEHGVDIVDVELTGATKAPCVRGAHRGGRRFGLYARPDHGRDRLGLRRH